MNENMYKVIEMKTSMRKKWNQYDIGRRVCMMQEVEISMNGIWYDIGSHEI